VLAVAGRGRDGEVVDLWRVAPVPRAGVVSEKLEAWNSRSSWRSVWPRSPCGVVSGLAKWDEEEGKGTDFVVDVYDGVVA
jgi:hypothetical protein